MTRDLRPKTFARYVHGRPGPASELRRKSDRVLATVLFTDIVGSTVRAEQLGDQRWHNLLDAHHTTVRRELARSRGNEVKSLGDGFLATFDGPASRPLIFQCRRFADTPLLAARGRASPQPEFNKTKWRRRPTAAQAAPAGRAVCGWRC